MKKMETYITIGDYRFLKSGMIMPINSTFNLITPNGKGCDNICGNMNMKIYAHKNSIGQLVIDNIEVGDVDMNDDKQIQARKLCKSLNQMVNDLIECINN